MNRRFKNREEAGRLLAEKLAEPSPQGASLREDNPLVLALPRGGVPVAYEIAKRLGLAMEVLVVRKIGAPTHPEYGIGAMIEGGYAWVDPRAAARAGATPEQIDEIVARERQEIEARVQKYRDGRPLPPLRGRTVILVDDGLATGVTARVAARFVEGQGAKRVILAVPVCAQSSADVLRAEVERLVCLSEPEFFHSVGLHFEDFEPVPDDEVRRLLAEARDSPESTRPREVELRLASGQVTAGRLVPPPAESARGIIVFAHGSGSNRLSPRNQQVAEEFHRAGFGTLLFDLLTPAEAEDRANTFDIPRLGHRMTQAVEWLLGQPGIKDLPLGLFGASTGAAAALWAAADPSVRPHVRAIVSRGGRPDLARPRLALVEAPTLLIVGGEDPAVIALNEEALPLIEHSELRIIRSASHLFEEPGALEEVSRDSIRWFTRHLGGEEGHHRGAA